MFCERLEAGGGDQILDLLRKLLDQAAASRHDALQTVDIPNDPGSFIESATPAELTAWQSVRPAVATLDEVAAIARQLGPGGAFPMVPDPRATDPGLECGWIDSRAVMCTSGDLLSACAQFQKPNPANDVRTSPWLRVEPHLRSVCSAAERVRLWGETEWQAREAQRPTSGQLLPDGTILADKRRNPFGVAH